MSRNWSLFLVVAFVLGFGTKTYLDGQKEVEKNRNKSLPNKACCLAKAINLSISSTLVMIEFVLFTLALRAAQMCAQPR